MQRFSYSGRDYAFGQAMLSLRTAIGLTQAGLAEMLGVSRKAIGRWEAGETYPKAEHLKAVLAFAVGQQAFPIGREEEEIRAFWHAAHQKMLLDERWLQGLLGQQPPDSRSWYPSPSKRRATCCSSWPSLCRNHGWIGARRWPCRASMDARRK